jgi:hypothetical protein
MCGSFHITKLSSVNKNENEYHIVVLGLSNRSRNLSLFLCSKNNGVG